jgi:hypothetical protein
MTDEVSAESVVKNIRRRTGSPFPVTLFMWHSRLLA